MNNAIARGPAARPNEEQSRRSVGLAVRPVAALIASATSTSAILLATVFIPWGNRYEAIGYRAMETSTTALYPHGFVATGTLIGVALVLVTAVALLTITAAIAGSRAQVLSGRDLTFAAIAALLIATVLPASVLEGFFGVVPAVAVITAILRAPSGRHGTSTVGIGEMVGWGVAVVVADALFSGLAVVAAVVLAFTRLRRAAGTQRWALFLFAVLIVVIHVLILGGGPIL